MITSVAGLRPTGSSVAYAMTKAALIMLTRQIASQFGRQGIRANVLAPGGVVRNHDAAFQEAYAANTSLGRMNTPDEVADALVFLASDASRGMTGENPGREALLSLIGGQAEQSASTPVFGCSLVGKTCERCRNQNSSPSTNQN